MACQQPEGNCMEQHKEEAQPDFCSGLVLQCFCSDVQRMLEAELLPRAADISASIAQMQQEIAETSHRAVQEKADVDAELNRLTGLVMAFQQAVAQFLPGVGF